MPDVAAAREFYRALFGWDYEDTGPAMGSYLLAELRGAGRLGTQAEKLFAQAAALFGGELSAADERLQPALDLVVDLAG